MTSTCSLSVFYDIDHYDCLDIEITRPVLKFRIAGVVYHWRPEHPRVLVPLRVENVIGDLEPKPGVEAGFVHGWLNCDINRVQINDEPFILRPSPRDVNAIPRGTPVLRYMGFVATSSSTKL